MQERGEAGDDGGGEGEAGFDPGRTRSHMLQLKDPRAQLRPGAAK